ncbi:MAG: hypothetical protein EPO58_09765 [Chitinophagaceae bacterium]|nr:MAG: hypothetical protein EPO58_09765 [Chitinophagaceae bacterium]
MRLNLTLFFLLLLSFTAQAQKMTGIWRGYFSSSSGIYREGFKEETYKYEIQLDQQSNNSVKGVTYSYKTTVFYGKAELNGIYTPTSKSIIIKETRLVDLKIGDKSEPCLMTCYLDYSRIGRLEVLSGTFISTNVKDKGDCGSGRVYLEKVVESDFKKEDFLLKNKKPADTSKTLSGLLAQKAPKPTTKQPANGKPKTVIAKVVPKQPIGKTPVKPGTKKTVIPAKPLVKTQTAPVKKPATRTVIPADKPATTAKPADRIPEQLINVQKAEAVTTPKPENRERKMPIPKVLVERENKLVKSITTSEEDIQIDIYDNGTIDNDTISLYHNNELVISNGKLNTKPFKLKIRNNKTDNRHELVMVAENLGEIPPNTALMVITAGKERYEVFLSSDEQRNAKVIINYVPKE